MAFRASASYESAGTSVTTFGVTVPGGVVTDDYGYLLVVWVGTAGETPPTCTAESGSGNSWSAIKAPTTSNNMGFALLSRRKGATDAGTVTVTLGNSRLVTAAAVWYSGVQATGTLGTVFSRSGTSQATTTAPSLTTAESGRTVLAFFPERTSTGGTTVSLNTGTQRVYLEGTGTSTGSALIAELTPATTVSGDVVATYSSSSGNASGFQLELVPVATVTVSSGLRSGYYTEPLTFTSSLDAFEALVGRQPEIFHWYVSFSASFPLANVQAVAARGQIPMLDWMPDVSTGTPSTNLNIAAGLWDTYIDTFAAAVKSYGGELWLRLGFEMNGNGWFQWQTTDFVAMWNHVQDRFTAAGVTNVKWVWSPNVADQIDYIPLSTVFPGTSRVDICGMDGYNWGNPAPAGHTSAWRSFATIFGDTITQIRALAPAKPLWVMETASAEAGGSKADWITDMFVQVRAYHLDGFCWFNANKEADWRVNSSTGALAAYQVGLASISGIAGYTGGYTGGYGPQIVVIPPGPPGPPPPILPPPGTTPPALVGPQWYWVTGTWSTGPDTLLSGARNRRITWRRVGRHEASFELDGRDPATGTLNELVDDLWLIRSPTPGTGRVLFRGRIGPTSDVIDADSHTVTVSAGDYRSVLDRRIIWDIGQRSWLNQDQAAIAWGLVQQAQAQVGGNLYIVRGVGQTTGVIRDRNDYQAGKSIGEAIDQLAAVENGFDWAITPHADPRNRTHYLDIWYPTRGVDRGVILDYGGRVASAQRQVDPGQYANAVRGTGAESTSTGGTLAPVRREASDIATRPESRWDGEMSDPDLIVQATITERTNRALAQRQIVTPSWTVVLTPNGWGGPDDIWLGDPVTLVVKSGRLNVVESLQVQELSAAWDENNTVTATLELGAIERPNKRWSLRRIDQRLRALERR